MTYFLIRSMRWWRKAGANNHLGGSFNMDLYLRICEVKLNQPK